MNANEVTETLTEIFQGLFNRPDLILSDDLTASKVAGWDSLKHIQIIVTIEEEFGVRFSNAEVTNLKNVGELKRLLLSKLG